MSKYPVIVSILVIVIVGLLSQSWFTVHQTQKAIVLQLGEPLPEVYGPGLHFKLPFIQNVVYFDSRVLDYEARSREAFTVDKKAIVLDNYARWKIINPLQFYRTMRTIPGAQARLDDVVYSQLRALVGAYTLTEVVSSHRAAIMKEVTDKVSELMKPFGVEAPFSNACAPNANVRPSNTVRKATRNPPVSVRTPTGKRLSSWRKQPAKPRLNGARAMQRQRRHTPNPITSRPISMLSSAGWRPCASPSGKTAKWF